jgi:hypothetical protein
MTEQHHTLAQPPPFEMHLVDADRVVGGGRQLLPNARSVPWGGA